MTETSQRKRSRRSNKVTVCVDVGEVDVDVDLAAIDTEDLEAELADRSGADSPSESDTFETMQKIRRLILLGRDREALDATKNMICDRLGYAI